MPKSKDSKNKMASVEKSSILSNKHDLECIIEITTNIKK